MHNKISHSLTDARQKRTITICEWLLLQIARAHTHRERDKQYLTQ